MNIVSNCCDATWTGSTTCHCSGCHETFASVGTFDRHRANYACRPPASCGLTIGSRGTWIRADAPDHAAA